MNTLYDYIIVGGGSAGCVLANRLSANPHHSVLLIEAGQLDTHPFLRMPKGFGKVLSDPSLVWMYRTQRKTPDPKRPEVWLRGKVLGGSSSVNGMVYVRGQPQDYDEWVEMGNAGWGWAEMSRCFREMEAHALGDDGCRGGSGPLHITPNAYPDQIAEALMRAGEARGLARKADINRPDQEGIGLIHYTIHRGQRWSASRAFIEPVNTRPNLHVATGAMVHRIVFEGTDPPRAAGVFGTFQNGPATLRAAREVIVAAGGIESPKLLQLSGVGPGKLLHRLGIPVLRDQPGVGAHMREHFLLGLQYRVRDWRYSRNREYSGMRLYAHALNYYLRRGGPLSTGSHDVCAFVRAHPASDRPDAQLMMTPTSRDFTATGIAFEREPGIQLFGYVLRPQSEGTVMIESADPNAPPVIHPNYLSNEYDRRVSVATVRYMREMLRQPPIQSILGEETRPGPGAQSDDEILEAFERLGQSGLHAAGTCRMGQDDDAVVDERLRVRGVAGLRVVDCSVLPTMISGNTNGPVMAVAWRAAEMIVNDNQVRRSPAAEMA